MNIVLRFMIVVLGLLLYSSTACAAVGVAVLKGTIPDSKIAGLVTLTEVTGGLKVEAEVKNVTPAGKRGFHIHENGSCEDAGKAAGGHFNPDAVQHGLLEKDGHEMAHAGDLGNIEIGEDGTGKLSGFLPGASLTEGKYNVMGKAVILHEKEDDFGQPTGNAGARVGCGIIEAKIGEIATDQADTKGAQPSSTP